ncbi:MAG: phosphatase PAP2 family protein [Polyangia bacterium]
MGRARRLGVVVLLAGVLAAPVAVADPPPPPEPKSVYQVNLPVDGAIILAGALGGIIPYALSSHLLHPSCPCPSSSVNSFDRGVIGNASDAADWASNVTEALAIAAPPIADWLVLRHGRIWLEDAVVFAETISLNGAFVTMAKYAFQRPVPRVYSGDADPTDPGNYRSFYSGHTSFTFAALSTASITIDARYGLTWQPWVVTLLVGSSVAAERVLGGFHFYSDVLIGAAAGTVIGTGVALLHLRAPGLRVSVFQPSGGGGAGVALAGAF